MREARFSVWCWPIIADGHKRSLAPKILDVDFMPNYTDIYAKAYRMRVLYEGKEYTIKISYTSEDTFNADTKCPYLLNIPSDLLWNRAEGLFGEAISFYQKKFFRLSEEEERKSWTEPLILAMMLGGYHEWDGKPAVDVRFYLYYRGIYWFDMTCTEDMTRFREDPYSRYQREMCYGSKSRQANKFFRKCKNMIKKYKGNLEALEDLVILDRPEAAPDYHLPKRYFDEIFG